jgi:hypothetical protein
VGFVMINTDNLKVLCANFREAILKTYGKDLSCNLRDFPKGCCQIVSAMLMKYLMDNGYMNIKYVYGEKGVLTHTWLQINDIIIDITADQFNSEDNLIKPIIVELNSEWHKQYDKKEIMDFEYFHNNIKLYHLLFGFKVESEHGIDILHDYNIILSKII